ncbi:MAG: polyphosphate kinase [Halobacteriovoraceae bacterium]|nr:polyphosphate kinase [Halobacteriovoraceae bacterium]
MIRRIALCFALWPASLAAHPHIFVETALRLEVDPAGILQAVEVTWAYDEFYSLLIFEDLDLDSDLDGALTEAELTRLKGFDLNWSEGFQGDLYLSQGEAPVPLGPPEHLSTEVVDGVITTRHRRVLTGAPVVAQGVTVRPYDPTYYTAYDLNGGVQVDGPCLASIALPDLDAAYTKVEELLYAMPADQVNDAYPEVGRAFATTVSLDCES